MYTVSDNIAMMKDPSRWPLYPFLPLKHRTRKAPDGVFPLHGTMVKFLPLRVYEIGFHSMDSETKFEQLPRIEYPNIEVLAEEWEVD